MLVDPHGEDDEGGAGTNSVAPQTDDSARSVHIIEATLVQDAPVTHAPPVPVYDATPVQDEEEVLSDATSVQDEEEVRDKEEETSWWKRYQKVLITVLALV